MKVGWIRSASRATLLALLLVAPQGCAYLQDRGDDAAEMIDIGVTWTKDPCFSFNLCLLGLASIGGGYMDGGFAGLGGGRGGIQRHYHNDVGLLVWSYDEWAWGDDYNIDDPQTLSAMYIGPAGWVQHPERLPDYAFA
ncbi:MAG: hypothetical protein HY812_21815 [Planctomycetes bacterium]|nr:hypothetical protein [Planctomycetota bacterium]